MQYSDKKIIYLTAGAGGMFCGSCMHDNALSRALSEEGWDIQLVPTYTPIRTDEKDFSVDQVLFGGINVYLQQKIPLLRYVPSVLDRFLDSPWLIRKVTSKAMNTDATMLGKLAFSMLQGSKGNQRKEVTKVCKWLRLAKPDLVIFSNVLIGGFIEDVKAESDVPILVTLQGDDVFLDSLQEPWKTKCIDRIKQIADQVDGFIVQSEFFRGYMSDYFSIAPERIHVTPLGLDTGDFENLNQANSDSDSRVQAESKPTQTIGYMARLAKEKGLHHLVDAFIELRNMPDSGHINLKVAGWLSSENDEYANEQWAKLKSAGLVEGKDFQYLGSINRKEKLAFFGLIDLLSVPTEFLEPKGIYALEALAAGVPVVLPSHGSFPELLEPSGGGVLCKPHDKHDLAKRWLELLGDKDRMDELGRKGQAYVLKHRNAKSMAIATSDLILKFV